MECSQDLTWFDSRIFGGQKVGALLSPKWHLLSFLFSFSLFPFLSVKISKDLPKMWEFQTGLNDTCNWEPQHGKLDRAPTSKYWQVWTSPMEEKHCLKSRLQCNYSSTTSSLSTIYNIYYILLYTSLPIFILRNQLRVIISSVSKTGAAWPG